MKNKSKNKVKKIVRILSRIAVLAILIAIIFSIVFLSGIFKVKSIEISINGKNDNGQKLTIEEIQRLSEISVNQNLFEMSKGEIKTNLHSNPYVESVVVSKNINGTVTISVEEREVKYLINYAGSYIYIDKNGYILEINSEAQDLPVIFGTSTDFTNLAVGEEENIKKLNDEDLEKLSVVNNIMEISKNNDIDKLISRVDISNSRNYVVYLDSENKTVYLGDCSNLNTRILYMKSIVKQEAGVQGEIYIDSDLNTGKVYFKESV